MGYLKVLKVKFFQTGLLAILVHAFILVNGLSAHSEPNKNSKSNAEFRSRVEQIMYHLDPKNMDEVETSEIQRRLIEIKKNEEQKRNIEFKRISTSEHSFHQHKNVESDKPLVLSLVGRAEDQRVVKIINIAKDLGIKVQLVNISEYEKVVEQMQIPAIEFNKTELDSISQDIKEGKIKETDVEQVISLKVEQRAEQRSFLLAIKEWWKSKHEKLTPEEKAVALEVGKSTFISKIVMGGVIWMNVGVDPYIAVFMTFSQAWVDYWWTINTKTIGNILGGSSGTDGGRKHNGFIQELKARLAISLAMTVMWRYISTIGGPYGSVHLLTTFQGMFEVLWNSTMKIPANIFATSANRRLPVETYRKLGTTIFILSSVISTIDLAGLSFWSHAMNVPMPGGDYFTVIIKDSNLLLAGFWAGTTTLVTFAPELFQTIVNSMYKFVVAMQTQQRRFYNLLNIVTNTTKKVLPEPVARATVKAMNKAEVLRDKLLLQHNSVSPVHCEFIFR